MIPKSCAPTASAGTPLAASSADVIAALLWILKKGTAQVSEGTHPGGMFVRLLVFNMWPQGVKLN